MHSQTLYIISQVCTGGGRHISECNACVCGVILMSSLGGRCNCWWYQIVHNVSYKMLFESYDCRADFSLVPIWLETSLQNNAAFHWLGTNLESALDSVSRWGQSIAACLDDLWVLQLKFICCIYVLFYDQVKGGPQTNHASEIHKMSEYGILCWRIGYQTI